MSVNVLDGNGNLKKIAHGFPESKFNVLRADIVENIELTDTASKNYAVGDYLILASGQLVKVINAISEDSVITSNDVQAITVEEMIANKADSADIPDVSKYKKIFTGTMAEWNQLTTEQKIAYDLANITDDLGTEADIVDAVTDGDMRAVTSNAVHDALESKISTSETTGLVKNDGSIDTKSYAEKVSNATENNLAGLDENGNLKDSGWSSDKTTTSATGNPISISGLKSNQLAIDPIITLEPMQDLHGQSKPYPAGGGKNLYSGTDVTISSALYATVIFDKPIPAGIYTISAKLSSDLTTSASASFRNSSGNNIARVDVPYVANGRGSVTVTLSEDAYKIYFYYSNTASGSGDRTWSDIQIESGSSPTSYAPYENICLINGYNKIEVLSCGKNIFDGGYSESGKYLNQDGTLTNGSSWYVTNYIVVKGGTSYTLSHSSSTSNNGICWYDANMTYIDGTLWGSATIKTITLPSNAKYIRASYYAIWISTFQIEEGSSETTYEPYVKATSISESLGQMVYGGTLDVRTGELEVIDTPQLLDLGSLNWNLSGSHLFYIDNAVANIKGSGSNGVPANMICECFSVTSYGAMWSGSPTNNTIALQGNGSRLSVYCELYSDTASFKTAMSGKYLCYELKDGNKFTIQLTPHEIALSQGYNYISTNGTSISLAYHNGELASLSDVAQVGETVNELGEYVECNEFGSYVDISSYGASNKYTFPSDGYIFINGRSNTTGYIRVYTYGKTSNAINGGISINITGTQQMASLFVRKGMRCYVDTNITGTSIQFISLA